MPLFVLRDLRLRETVTGAAAAGSIDESSVGSRSWVVAADWSQNPIAVTVANLSERASE